MQRTNFNIKLLLQLTTTVMIMIATNLHGQTLTGHVQDEQGQPMIGCNVYIEDSYFAYAFRSRDWRKNSLLLPVSGPKPSRAG